MRTLNFYIIMSFIFLSGFGFASEGINIEYARKLCRETSPEIAQDASLLEKFKMKLDDKAKFLDYVKAGYSEEDREFYDLFRTSNSLNKLFESEEYYQALYECFGDNPKMIKGFTFNLFLADWLGRVGQFLTFYWSGKVLAKPFAKLASRFITPYQFMRTSIKWLKVIGVSSISIASAYILLLESLKSQYYDAKQGEQNESVKWVQNELGDAVIDSLEAEIKKLEENANNLKEKTPTTISQEEINKINNKIEKLRKVIARTQFSRQSL